MERREEAGAFVFRVSSGLAAWLSAFYPGSLRSDMSPEHGQHCGSCPSGSRKQLRLCGSVTGLLTGAGKSVFRSGSAGLPVSFRILTSLPLLGRSAQAPPGAPGQESGGKQSLSSPLSARFSLTPGPARSPALTMS